MEALPSLIALLVAAAIVPAAVRSLVRGGHVCDNWRGSSVAFPGGIAVVTSALVALAAIAPLNTVAELDVLPDELRVIALYTLGVALLGLIDDLFGGSAAEGAPAPRGWRGHAAAARAGTLSTGAIKAVGSLGLAFLALSGWREIDQHLVAVAVLVLSTNLFNLLDLRPGRSLKALVLLGAGLTLGAWDTDPAVALGLFLAPLAVFAFYDVRELAMLGDTGSNLVGALAGWWLVLTLSPGEMLIALAALSIVTVYGEFRSISALVERNPLLRRLDSLARPR